MVGAAKVPCLAAEFFFFRIHSFSVCFTCSPSKPEACLPYSSRSPQSEKAGRFDTKSRAAGWRRVAQHGSCEADEAAGNSS